MTLPQKKEYIEKLTRIKAQREQEFQKIDNYHKELRSTTLTTFKDRPDEINTVRCVHVESNMFVVEWDKPANNNSKIQGYNVYLSSKTLKVGVDLASME